MSTSALRVFAGAYRDSLLLLSATRAMRDGDGVEWATALLAIPANIDDLAADGFRANDLAGAGANDLVLAVRAADDAAAGAALERGRALLFAETGPAGTADSRAAPRTIGDAVAQLPAANVAVVSVPGPYASLAAHACLSWAQAREPPCSAAWVLASRTRSGPGGWESWPPRAPGRRR